jgi:hypothetical protein
MEIGQHRHGFDGTRNDRLFCLVKRRQ